MTQEQSPPKSDITTEAYKGPGVAVAAAGYMFYAHWVMAAIGLGVGAVGSYFGYKHINKLETSLRNFHQIHRTPDHGWGTRLMATIAGAITKAAHWIAEEIPGAKQLRKRANIPEERLEAAVFGGGLLGAFGFFIAPWVYGVKGGLSAHQGQQQFKHAQDEIRHLREKLKAQVESSANTGETPAKHQDNIAENPNEYTTATPKTKVTSERAHLGSLENSAAIAAPDVTF
ncbi:MAG: hypothetical protein ACK5VT_06245 [Alphaproteobacteria bacterium]